LQRGAVRLSPRPRRKDLRERSPDAALTRDAGGMSLEISRSDVVNGSSCHVEGKCHPIRLAGLGCRGHSDRRHRVRAPQAVVGVAAGTRKGSQATVGTGSVRGRHGAFVHASCGVVAAHRRERRGCRLDSDQLALRVVRGVVLASRRQPGVMTVVRRRAAPHDST
jgi:hypothetical protein